jgi:hypothetical protein
MEYSPWVGSAYKQDTCKKQFNEKLNEFFALKQALLYEIIPFRDTFSKHKILG